MSLTGAASGLVAGIRATADRTLAALLLATCLVVPLMLTLVSEDVFALPKLIALSFVAISGLALAGLGASWRPRPQLRPVSIADLALATFMLLKVRAWARSPDPWRSLGGEYLQYQGLLSTLLYACFLLLARASLGHEARAPVLFGAITAGAVLVAVYALFQRAGLDPFWEYPIAGRPFSTLGHANALAAYLVLAVPASISLLAWTRSWAAGVVIILGNAVILVALLETLSRAGYLGLLLTVSVLVVTLARGLPVSRASVAIGALIAVVVMGAVSAIPPIQLAASQIWHRALSIADIAHPYIQLRFALLQVGLRMVHDHPLLGIGPEMFPEVFPRYRDLYLTPVQTALFSGFRAESPHNVYLAVAVGAGLPTLLAYVTLIVSVLVSVARAIRSSTASGQRIALATVLAALSGHLVTDLFMTAELTSSTTFWILMGVGLGLARRAAPVADAQLVEGRNRAVGTRRGQVAAASENARLL